MKKVLAIAFVALMALVPLTVGAQTTQGGSFGSIQNSLITIINLINKYVIPLLIGFAVLMFLYGLVQYVTSGGEEGAREKARYTILYGIIVIAVMVSVYGLVRFVLNTFGLEDLNQQGLSTIPKVPTVGGSGL